MNKLGIDSKLPRTGITIFTQMSALANEHQALNLSQGFPNFPVDTELIDRVTFYMREGVNQYAPMIGVQPLRERIAEKTRNLYGADYHHEKEITITSGATEALYNAITALINPGDEVVVFEPAYDSYVPVIELNGGMPVYVTLSAPHFKIDWELVKQLITPRTRMMILNSPHNPATSVLTSDDLNQLASIVRNTDIIILSDEVYEHIVFDGRKHASMMKHPVLKERSLICGSFGKTFHATGWKVGYCLAPEVLTTEFRKIHQFVTFCTHSATQMALADYLADASHYQSVSSFYQAKRDVFLDALKGSRFSWIPSQGSYFQNLNYSAITNENDVELAQRLTREIGVASIPVSAFYHQKNDFKTLRFCFAKDDETLREAGRRLSSL